jgi:hypothetical protein
MATRKPTKNVRLGKRTKKPTKSRVATMSTRTGMAALTPKQALAALPVVDKRPNTMFPGLPNYTGPIHGYFAMLHHQQLFEKTQEGVMERVRYVRTKKPPHERAVRLRNMMYLGDCQHIAVLEALETALRFAYDCDGAYELRRPIEQAVDRTRVHIRQNIIAYIAWHNHKHDWNEVMNSINGIN